MMALGGLPGLEQEFSQPLSYGMGPAIGNRIWLWPENARIGISERGTVSEMNSLVRLWLKSSRHLLLRVKFLEHPYQG